MDKNNEKHTIRNFIVVSMFLMGIYRMLKFVATKYTKCECTNINNPYLKKEENKKKQKIIYDERTTTYVNRIKPIIDKILSFVGIIVLFPILIVISIAIYVDDPGSIFFVQKRVGRNKLLFFLHKFRTMKVSAPHDVPTHQLKNPDQYITRVGKILRATSLDELPQIWDIFRGKMSIVGPRPALWNQDDLIAEREKYGANDIMPGLTGLAQIKGRDELEIVDKARIDGEYAKLLRTGGWEAFFQDMKCLVGTIGSVLRHDGVIEGGTGNLKHSNCMENIKNSNTEFDQYGYKKKFNIDKAVNKRILITGAGSYIGNSFLNYANTHYPNLFVDTIDMIDVSWKYYDFASYDTVFHVAGIAHSDINNISAEEKKKYYKVNRDLAVETCKKAKESGVKQFVFMSSMIIYGESKQKKKSEIIDEYTIPTPVNVYGDSKWRADKKVRELQSSDFNVAVLRSPMIYGKGGKGNYLKLSNFAKWILFFPDIKNKRSMIYIDNLCEFLCLIILSGEGGIYFPQNKEYSNTSELVRFIAKANGNTIYLNKLLNPIVFIASHFPGRVGAMVKKAFGSFAYSPQISEYEGLEYQVIDIEESIRRIEGKEEERF